VWETGGGVVVAVEVNGRVVLGVLFGFGARLVWGLTGSLA
jgi:hypothetical protein